MKGLAKKIGLSVAVVIAFLLATCETAEGREKEKSNDYRNSLSLLSHQSNWSNTPDWMNFSFSRDFDNTHEFVVDGKYKEEWANNGGWKFGLGVRDELKIEGPQFDLYGKVGFKLDDVTQRLDQIRVDFPYKLGVERHFRDNMFLDLNYSDDLQRDNSSWNLRLKYKF